MAALLSALCDLVAQGHEIELEIRRRLAIALPYLESEVGESYEDCDAPDEFADIRELIQIHFMVPSYSRDPISVGTRALQLKSLP